jgi:hypothetical protein
MNPHWPAASARRAVRTRRSRLLLCGFGGAACVVESIVRDGMS